MGQTERRRSLQASGLVHPRPEAVRAPLFTSHEAFFFAEDKLQVKYEMLRAHVVDGMGVGAAAAAHGYSRAGFYLAWSAFEEAGMGGLIDARPGRRGPLKLYGEVAEFVRGADADLSGAQVAKLVEERFGVSLHRRTIERARAR
jgi:transposase